MLHLEPIRMPIWQQMDVRAASGGFQLGIRLALGQLPTAKIAILTATINLSAPLVSQVLLIIFFTWRYIRFMKSFDYSIWGNIPVIVINWY